MARTVAERMYTRFSECKGNTLKKKKTENVRGFLGLVQFHRIFTQKKIQHIPADPVTGRYIVDAERHSSADFPASAL